ncbi:Tetratricopeptide-like helical [Penicillium freii]|nr:Tetratricopeptide-like helical [Penicillium freii]
MGLWNVNLGTLSGSGGAKEALAKLAMLVEVESALVGAETLTELKGGFPRVNSDMKISRQLEETRMQTEMTRQERITANLRRLLQHTAFHQPRTSIQHNES